MLPDFLPNLLDGQGYGAVAPVAQIVSRPVIASIPPILTDFLRAFCQSSAALPS